MSRVKRGFVARRRRRRILKATKGYRGTTGFRIGAQRLRKAQSSQYRDRRLRKRFFRRLWIQRLNAFCRPTIRYSQVISQLKFKKRLLNRKMLSQLCIFEPGVLPQFWSLALSSPIS